ncbi:MAG: hypothetical protein IPL96_04225, partial [Holophagaceae bacterium]|nr:hypothetical protein [Holophagaceae bacterium]
MRPMRIIPLIVALAALPLPAPAAGPAVPGGMASSGGPASWDAFLAQQRGENEGANLGDGRWVLVLRPEDAADSWWMADDTFRRLQASQEFRVVQLGAAVGRDLWSDRGWNNDAKWILLDPAAERVKELNGRPTGEQALTELKGLGFKPRWERRETFLREHPDHGEAWAEALQQGMTLVFTRYQQYQKEGRIVRAETQAPPPGPFAAFGRSGAMTFATGSDPSGATLADEAYGDAAEALRHLVEIKGWQDFQGLFMAALAYQNMGAAQSPKMKALAPRMAQELQDELARNPHNESAWLQFGALARAAGLSPMDAFRKAVPVPGQPWPPVPLLTAVVQEFAAREDWEGAFAFLREFETLAADPGLSKEGWRAYTGTRASLEVGKAQCLARLGRWNEVGPALQEVQRWAGSRWDGQYARALRFAIPELRGERQEQFKALMDAEDLPDLPAPAPPPALRLVLLGAPPWKESWDRLRKAGPLQPWAPGELAWEQLSGPALEAALQKHGWPREPQRYALLRGDEVLASGVGCPYPEDLAAQLAALQPSRYGRLSDLIRKHPDHLAAHKARAELAFARMPNGHLEPTLAEDARVAQLVPDTSAPVWTPNPELWQWSAQKVLPEAERTLQA